MASHPKQTGGSNSSSSKHGNSIRGGGHKGGGQSMMNLLADEPQPPAKLRTVRLVEVVVVGVK